MHQARKKKECEITVSVGRFFFLVGRERAKGFPSSAQPNQFLHLSFVLGHKQCWLYPGRFRSTPVKTTTTTTTTEILQHIISIYYIIFLPACATKSEKSDDFFCTCKDREREIWICFYQKIKQKTNKQKNTHTHTPCGNEVSWRKRVA